jgi:hypothetical protein
MTQCAKCILDFVYASTTVGTCVERIKYFLATYVLMIKQIGINTRILSIMEQRGLVLYRHKEAVNDYLHNDTIIKIISYLQHI